MNKMILTAAGLVLLGASSAASAVGIGIKASTLGAGIELGVPVSDSLVARAAVNQYSLGRNENIDGVDYNADLDLKSTAVFLDWYPFKGTFHLTAGYVNSSNKLTGTANPTGTVNIGGVDYPVTGQQDLSLHAVIDLGSGPYLGLGWGNVPAKGLGVTFELGVVQQGSPDVTLTASGTYASAINPNDLKQEEQNMQNDLNKYELYPVVSLGLSYGF